MFRQRHKAAARALWQAFQERLDLVLEHARHQPFGAFLAHLIEHEQRHGHGETIARVARAVQVAGRAVHAAELDGLGEFIGGDARGLVAHELVFREAQQLGLALADGAKPLVKGGAAVNALGNGLVVEGVDQLVVHQHVLAPALVLQLFDLAHRLVIRGQEGPGAVPLALDQRAADEHLPRLDRVDAAITHAALVIDHQAIERGALVGHHVGLLLAPMRVEQLLPQQMAAHLFQPLRLDGGNAPAIQARGLHLLGGDDPAPGLLRQMRARMRVELDAMRAQVGLALLALETDVAQQAGEHGQVHRLVARRLGVELPLVLTHHGQQLRMDVAPLAHAANVQVVLA